ncbi:MAG: glycosyltransferase family 2 protein [Chitinophagaceae bacterium]|nr:glycosyltransferase family 2 protein [Chitinophagaceae bacterium]
MEKLTVVIITFNEEGNIGRCLESVTDIADEIVILDSNSTDKTVEIARGFGAKVVQQPFAGYIEQKNKALNLATHDFVLCLDADEALDTTLRESIKKEKNEFRAQGYSMNRCTFYCGKFIRHGTWYPDRKLRLFNKKLARWKGINPHDKVEFDSPQKQLHLAGDLLHYSYNSLEEHSIQNNRFSTISAQAYFTRGKKFSWLNLLVNPSWAFINGYIIRGGFLDGIRGFIIAKNVAHLTFMKYYKLYALHKGIPVK